MDRIGIEDVPDRVCLPSSCATVRVAEPVGRAADLRWRGRFTDVLITE